MHHCNHNPNKPLQFWFQESHEGTILFIVFYTQACRYGRCVGCNLYLQQSKSHIDRVCLMNQIDLIFNEPSVLAKSKEITKVIISNNGSILDETTFSSTALMYFMFLLNRNLPNTKILSVETRPEYADLKALDFLDHIRQETFIENIEIAVGVEAWSDHIRNEVFGKGVSNTQIERFVKQVSEYGFLVKTYFMFKPVPMTDEEAVEDICWALTWMDTLAKNNRAKINFHLNPTYVARGTRLEAQFENNEFQPPFLKDVITSVLTGIDKELTIFVGLNDEGLAIPGGSFIRPGDEELVKKLEEFNRTQDFEFLKKSIQCLPVN